ncbi:unnamed protein product [Symbiodinium necroappetens]|uniref:DUF1565 domain-containing protein n=1 Tax=Symbiodinium necroappetens TaxID=1628268 RepID=A0A812YHK0_9DINO|nr:unnamed protein product [Symbiodinium necroappetens]
MISWLLLGLFLVGAHRDSRHFAVQLDDEIEESPSSPAILASPENVSSVLASVNAAEPMRVHLLAGVYQNVTFTLPPDANLELQGEPGTKVEDLYVKGYTDETPRQGMLNSMVIGSVISFRTLATSYARAEGASCEALRLH